MAIDKAQVGLGALVDFSENEGAKRVGENGVQDGVATSLIRIVSRDPLLVNDSGKSALAQPS